MDHGTTVAGVKVHRSLIHDHRVLDGQTAQDEFIVVEHIHRPLAVDIEVILAHDGGTVVEQAAVVREAAGEGLIILAFHGVDVIRNNHFPFPP